MASYVYPAVFHPDTEEGGFLVTYPDLPGCLTEGKDLDDALYMAQDVLRGWLSYALEAKYPVAPPSPPQSIPLEEGEFINFIRTEVKDSRAVRRTVSIPKWLDEKVTDSGISLSRVLQEALKERLGVQ